MTQVNATPAIFTLVLFAFCVSNVMAQQKPANDDFLGTFDLDGDGVNDWIHFDFSGGAHCCYKISIVLTSDKIERNYPFQMDGGYIGGVDNSKPHQFDIRDVDGDGLPEILMQIQTYNGIAQKIPRKWRRKYNITGNRIVIEYENGQLEVKDTDQIQ